MSGASDAVAAAPAGGVPGKYVVVAMFALAIALTGFLWIYTRLHRAPFIPLRTALVEEFGRASAPRVEGGRPRRGPMTLRVVLRTAFDPSLDDDATRAEIERVAERVVALARQHVEGFEQYEQFHFVLLKFDAPGDGTAPRFESTRPLHNPDAAPPR